jgi:hypothetical protein
MSMRRFLIEKYETIDLDVLRANRDHIYAVELTLDGQVCNGAGLIMNEPNACGIPVRKAIVEDTHVPFSDQEIEHEALLQALRRLYRMATDRTLRLPHTGIGTGPHGLAVHSPRIYRDLCQILADHFGYRHAQSALPYAARNSDIGEVYHHDLFKEVCKRGGFYMTHLVAEKHGLTLDQLKAHCLAAGRELEAEGKLFAFHLPTYRWASGE